LDHRNHYPSLSHLPDFRKRPIHGPARYDRSIPIVRPYSWIMIASSHGSLLLLGVWSMDIQFSCLYPFSVFNHIEKLKQNKIHKSWTFWQNFDQNFRMNLWLLINQWILSWLIFTFGIAFS
jgi:hypothetical protein